MEGSRDRVSEKFGFPGLHDLKKRLKNSRSVSAPRRLGDLIGDASTHSLRCVLNASAPVCDLVRDDVIAPTTRENAVRMNHWLRTPRSVDRGLDSRLRRSKVTNQSIRA